jgi:hypothetical protein
MGGDESVSQIFRSSSIIRVDFSIPRVVIGVHEHGRQVAAQGGYDSPALICRAVRAFAPR